MKIFDSSSLIHAWDNYPLVQFPGLWQWIAEQMAEGKIAMPKDIYEKEIKDDDLAQWLKEHQLQKLVINNTVVMEAMKIKESLGIKNDNYHPKGVGENDILLIATAKVYNVEVVTEEARQPKLPSEFSKRKIPAVCSMSHVSVGCINFTEYLKSSRAVFG